MLDVRADSRIFATALLCLAVAAVARPLSSGQAAAEPASTARPTDAVKAPSADLRVKWEGGKLTLDVEGAPLSEVLLAVSGATGIQVMGAQRLSNLVSAHFTRVELLEALKKLLARVDHVIAAGPPDSTPAERTRVIILPAMAASEPPTSLVQPPMSLVQPTDVPTAPESATQDPDADRQVGQRTSLSTTATDVPAARGTAAANGDSNGVRESLQDTDSTGQPAAVEALLARDRPRAMRELMATIQDAGQPARLQALTMLVQAVGDDEQTVMTALREAFRDPDPAFHAYSAQTLAGRASAKAMAVLREAYQNAVDPSTRLMIVESVAHTEGGSELLSEALADSDDTVRDTARALLKR